MSLKNKIPPPVVALIFLVGIYLSAGIASIGFAGRKYIAAALFLSAISIMIFAVTEFRKRETTINPLKPEKSTALVTSGVFEQSRNPMYLGLFGILLAASVYLGAILATIMLPLFVWYMNVFQISPEEAAMEKLFGDEFEAYRANVRRWI